MCADSADFPNIVSITASELAQALRLVFIRVEPRARKVQIETALEEINRSGIENQIVLAARRGKSMVAALWLQMQAGGVGSLWPPGLITGEPAATALALIDLASAKAEAAGARLLQSLVETDSGPESGWLLRCGFKHAADLLYLVSPRDYFPTEFPEGELVFEPLSEIDEDAQQFRQLAEVVERTYQGTLDCPAVQGQRSIDDVLAGYRGVGAFDASRWFLVRNKLAGTAVGCLLLTSHPSENQWELVYMGVVPEARGRQFGVEMVRYAQWLCGKSPAERLVLAVDAANAPAISAYAAAGFETWDRRSVFLRFASA